MFFALLTQHPLLGGLYDVLAFVSGWTPLLFPLIRVNHDEIGKVKVKDEQNF